MAWTKHFSPAKGIKASYFGGGMSYPNASTSFQNYASTLPEVYTGHPNRIERYFQYAQMDRDSEINTGLDIISEFCTQENVANGTAFNIYFQDNDPTDNEVKIIKDQLKAWYKLNDFSTRLFKIFRNTLIYGDQIMIRDPQTMKWIYIDMNKMDKIIVNESKGKEPEQYVIRDLNLNLQNMSATEKVSTYSAPGSGNTTQSGGGYGGVRSGTHGAVNSGGRFDKTINQFAIDAQHVIHVSLTEGLDENWPFGISILENIFKPYKQKELIEDAVLIYRFSRAPERRVFKIDVGGMPPHIAMTFIERVKNELHQKRFPSLSGGNSNVMDSTYNPLSFNEDYFFPVSAEGRGSDVTTLPGGTQLGEIDDLRYFSNKLMRGLGIPSSYLPSALEDATASHGDGRVGTAMIQEWRFNQYCMRLQKLMARSFDLEFKYFLRHRGVNIDNSIFDLRFNEPQNFSAMRQSDLDGTRIGVFGSVADLPYMSKRFAMKRYLGMSAEEMQENAELWKEEMTDDELAEMEGTDLRSIGVTPGGLEGDLGDFDEDSDADMEDMETAIEQPAPGSDAPLEGGTAPAGPSGF